MTEETKPAPPSAKDIVVQIAAAIKSYADGGPDREAETIALAVASGLRTDGIAKQWRDVKASRPKASLEHKVIAKPVEAAPQATLVKPPASAAVPLVASGAVPIISRRLAPAPMAESALARLGLKAVLAPMPVARPEPKAEAKPSAEHDAEDIELAEAVGTATRAGDARGLVVLPPMVPSDFVLPQVGKAKEIVEEINKRHALIGNHGDKCVVLSWERWKVNPSVYVPTYQSLAAFTARYQRHSILRQTENGVKREEAGKYWLGCPGGRGYDGVGFEPGQKPLSTLIGNQLNLWRGFAVKPKPGSWTLMHEHIYRILAGGDVEAGHYILRWLAWTVQNPGKAAEAVLVFRGNEGTGKGTLARVMLRIFGSAGLPMSNAKHLTGQFSGHLQHCVFLFLDEAFVVTDAAAEARLKDLVVNPTFSIEPKYLGLMEIRNLLHIMMASNNDWVVPAGHGSRRYAVFQVSDARVDDFSYFDKLNAELDGGGVEALLHDLLRLKLGDWHPKRIYKTAALLEQKGHSLRGLDAWIESLLQEGTLPNAVLGKPNRSLSDDLEKSALQFDKFTNKVKVAQKLKKLFKAPGSADDETLMTVFNNQVARGWAFPPLSECRQIWEARNGGHWQWLQEVEEWGGAKAKPRPKPMA